MSPACLECAALAEGSSPGVLRRGLFAVHAKLEAGAVPGWMIVAPLRHVEQVDALRADEQAALFPLLSEVAGALRAETACEKIYIAVFAEVLPHLHVHLIARPPGWPESQRGPGLFTATASADPRETESVTRRVLSRLAVGVAAKKTRDESPLRAALLSALLCPGAGQIRNREYGKGIALVALTLAAAAAFLVRMLTEVLRSLPTDTDVVDPLSAWDLARTIQDQRRGEFLVYTLVLAGLWVYATVDAWVVAKRRAERPVSRGRRAA